jgi:cytochrome P450
MGLLALLRNPEALERLREGPDLAPSATEELLRYDSPVQRLRRRAREDVELRGRRIRAGDLVMAFNGAANRDPERFPDPDRLDLARGDSGHLSFGHGIHFCVGAALTRIEAPIALNALLRRFPRLRLAGDEQIRWRPNITFRGLEALPLHLR